MEGSLPGALLALAYFGVFQLCGPCLARLALPRESAGSGCCWAAVGQPVPAVVPRAVCLSAGLCPSGPPGALALALLCAGAALWKGRGRPGVRQAPLRLWQEEIPSGWCWGVGVLLLFGVAFFPLAGRRGLFQPGHLRGHEHAPELPHQLGKPGDFLRITPCCPARGSPTLFCRTASPPACTCWGAPVAGLPASPCGWRGPGAFWNLRLFRPDGP